MLYEVITVVIARVIAERSFVHAFIGLDKPFEYDLGRCGDQQVVV